MSSGKTVVSREKLFSHLCRRRRRLRRSPRRLRLSPQWNLLQFSYSLSDLFEEQLHFFLLLIFSFASDDFK